MDGIHSRHTQPISRPSRQPVRMTSSDRSRFRSVSPDSSSMRRKPLASRVIPQAQAAAAPLAQPKTQLLPATKPRAPHSIGELAKAVVAAEAFKPGAVMSVAEIALPAKKVSKFKKLSAASFKKPALKKAPEIAQVAVIPTKHLPPIDMDLPGEESPLRSLDLLLRHGKLAAVRRWTYRGAAAMIIFVLVVGGFLVSQGFLLNKSFKGTGTVAALRSNVDPSMLKGEGDGRINVLLMGRGGGTHDAPDLTDTMMLASIDPVNHTTTLMSIPRDLWVDVQNQGTMKINAAFESGEFKYQGNNTPGSTNPNAIQAGFNEADQVVESVLGVTIHYNVLVDFQAFKQSVDTVGGVTANVPADVIDPTMAWENGNSPVIAKAGVNTFNGKQALNYARSRETSSDFSRGERQRILLTALKTKVATAGTLSNPLKVSKLFKAFGNNVRTDLSIKNATRLYSIVKKIPDNKVTSVGMADPPNNYMTTGTLAGQAITLPSAGLFNYNDIKLFVRTQLKDPYIIKEHAKVAVLNGTTTLGLAGTKADDLKTYGYNVVATGNTPTPSSIQTVLVDMRHAGKNKYTKRYLEQRFGVSATNELPDKGIQTNGADFVIILGSDATLPPQN